MRAAILSLCLLACDNTVPTPAGTALIDVPAFTKMGVSDWTVGASKGPTTKVSKTFRFTPGELGPPVRFQIAFEHGPSEFIVAKPKESTPATVDVPRAVHIEVRENTAWAMTTRCEDALNVPLAVNPDGTTAYPKSVWAKCMIVMRRKDGRITVAPLIQIYGDGKLVVDPAGGDDEKIVEEP